MDRYSEAWICSGTRGIEQVVINGRENFANFVEYERLTGRRRRPLVKAFVPTIRRRTLLRLSLSKAAAELAFDAFIESFTPKYEKAADCLSKDRDTLLAVLRSRPSTGNTCGPPIPFEGTFATVRHRTIRSKGCLSNRTALAMVFKLL